MSQEENITVNVADFCTMIGLEDIKTASFSNLFILQLIWFHYKRELNTAQIIDEIRQMEGFGKRRTNTIRKSEFRHPPLRGFKKKHFFQARFIPKNIMNYWGLGEGMVSKKMRDLFEEIYAGRDEIDVSELASRLSDAVVMRGYKEKAALSKLTGEWIVLKTYDDRNYYLAIAEHTNDNESDKRLYDFLCTYCKEQYPFLFSENDE